MLKLDKRNLEFIAAFIKVLSQKRAVRARDLGVSQAGLNRWVNHAKQQEALGRPAFTGRGVIALSESEQEIKDLKREVETLRLEREICLNPKTHLSCP